MGEEEREGGIGEVEAGGKIILSESMLDTSTCLLNTRSDRGDLITGEKAFSID
jgi:hypothetical protein